MEFLQHQISKSDTKMDRKKLRLGTEDMPKGPKKIPPKLFSFVIIVWGKVNKPQHF